VKTKPNCKIYNEEMKGAFFKVHVPAYSPCLFPGINQALSNAYLKSQGLYELRDGWIKLHHSQ
jgi:hypothetical protein